MGSFNICAAFSFTLINMPLGFANSQVIEFNSSYPAQATMTDLLGRTIITTVFDGSINIPVVH